MSIKVKGKNRLFKRLSKLSKESQSLVKKAVTDSAIDYQSKLVELINKGTRSGITYSRGGRFSVRSASGEPPKSDTGALVNSLNIKSYDKGFVKTIGTILKYAKALEFGFAPRNLLPRPFMSPTFKENQGNYSLMIKKALRKAFRKRQ